MTSIYWILVSSLTLRTRMTEKGMLTLYTKMTAKCANPIVPHLCHSCEAEYCASPNDSCEEAFPNGKTGTCVKADFTKLDVGGKTYYVSHYYMSWWDADAACKALGSDGLVSVNDLVTGWAGKDDSSRHNFTALVAALQSHLETGYEVWTSDDYSSCIAFRVYLLLGYVRNYGRNGNGVNFAVCQ